MQETLCENQYKDVSESECNIDHEKFIAEQFSGRTRECYYVLKDDMYDKPSVIGKVTSYFNIFKCSINLLDQFDVTYQRAFMASPVREEYHISPAR